MSEYTPDTGAVRAVYTRAMRQAFIASTSEHIEQFDRWLARHDKALRRKMVEEATEDVITHDEALEKALRKQIARDIEAHIDDDGTDEWFAAIDLATSIAKATSPGESTAPTFSPSGTLTSPPMNAPQNAIRRAALDEVGEDPDDYEPYDVFQPALAKARHDAVPEVEIEAIK